MQRIFLEATTDYTGSDAHTDLIMMGLAGSPMWKIKLNPVKIMLQSSHNRVI